LLNKYFSEKDRFFYKKWLRFYWDFCQKYQHDAFHLGSLPLFLQKLQNKNQSEEQQSQAKYAVSLFLKMCACSEQPLARGAESVKQSKVVLKYSEHENNHSAIVQNAVEEQPYEQYGSNSSFVKPRIEDTGASWVFVFDQLVNEIKIRHYSPKTLKAYRGYIRQLQTFTKSKDYQKLSQQDVIDFLTFLAVEKQVSAASQHLAFNSLLFLFKHVLKKEFGEIKGVVRPKRKTYIPVVLSRQEIDLIFDYLDDPVDLIVKLLYGCGLRLFECLKLRVQDFNFDAGIVTIHNGKGKKDRTLPIPQSIVPDLQKQLQKVAAIHEADLKVKFSGTFLPDQLDRKYKNAAKEFIWQWFFPAKSLTLLSETKEHRRYHIHESVVSKAIKQAVNDARITKRATAHTLRHSFASHLLQANYDIRTIQELLGHSDVRTTMIYTHTVQSRTLKQTKSPLDFDQN
jgi:integron integrase